MGGEYINTRPHIIAPKALEQASQEHPAVETTPEPCATRQPRAVGVGHVSSKLVPHGTGRLENALDRLHHSGAMKLLFPHRPTQRRTNGANAEPALEAVVVNTAGGITGGDRFKLHAEAGAGSQLTVTTQAAERAYRAQTGETGEMLSKLFVAEGARLNWLPQETILFQCSSYRRRLRADLAPDAAFLMIEPLVFGRAAMGEVVTQTRFSDRVEIFRDGQRIYYDAIALDGDLSTRMRRPAIGLPEQETPDGMLSSAGAMASLIWAAPGADSALGWMREALAETGEFYGGVSALSPDLIHCRILAADSYLLRKALLPLLDRLTDNTLPRCWRL